MFEILYYRWRRYITPHGGRGSGKSRTVALVLVIIAVVCKRFIVLARNYESETENSIWKNIKDRIIELELSSLFKVTEKRITCLASGTIFEKVGLLEDPEKIKSLESCDILCYEEADKATMRVWDKVLPTIRDVDGERVSIISIFNPSWKKSPTYKTLITEKDELELGHFTRLINYLDNPFCPESILLAAEKMKRLDYEKYLNEYLGVPKDTSDLQIMNGCYEIAEFDPNTFERNKNSPNYLPLPRYYFGIQWGYAQKSLAAVLVFEYDNCLFIYRSAGRIGMELDDITEEINKLPGIQGEKVRADPKLPATIKNVRVRSNLRIIEAETWTGEDIDKIIFLRGEYKRIYIHPECNDVIDDFENYFWDYDPKLEKVLPVPVDDNNQFIKAIGHAICRRVKGYV